MNITYYLIDFFSLFLLKGNGWFKSIHINMSVVLQLESKFFREKFVQIVWEISQRISNRLLDIDLVL